MALSEILTTNPPRDAESQARLARIREQWVYDVTTLVQQVMGWALAAKDAHHWEITTEAREIAEESIGNAYQVPILTIHAGENDLYLEPVGRRVPDADGRVDLYAWPSLFRVMLLRKGEDWIVHTDSGIDWPQPWNEETFFHLANSLLNAK